MKRLYTILTFFCLFTCSLFADEQREVVLGNDHKTETITLNSLCNIFLKMEIQDDESVLVSFALENLKEDMCLLLFDQSYSEKILKKQTPKIFFDKGFPGARGDRFVEPFRNWDDVCQEQLNPSDKRWFASKKMQNGDRFVLRLPLYIASVKSKTFVNWHSSKLYLMQKETIDIILKIKLQPDADLIRLTAQADSLQHELDKKPFCVHRDHKQSLKEQEAPYRAVIDRIIQEAEDIYLDKSDNCRAGLNALMSRLRGLNLGKYQTLDCGNRQLHKRRKPAPVRPVITCKYCNQSLQGLYHKMDDLYTEIYNSSNRGSAKQRCLPEVEKIFKCCSKHDKHAREWRQGGFYKNKITKRYNDIKDL